MSEWCQMVPSSFWLKFLNFSKISEGSFFCSVCLNFIYGTFLCCCVGTFRIYIWIWLLWRSLRKMIWSLGISDESSFEVWEGDFSEECSDPELDSLCKSESEHDSQSDSESESESETSPEWSPLTTSFVGVEGCCKDSTQGRISAEWSSCLGLGFLEGVALRSVKDTLESFWVGMITEQFLPSMWWVLHQ